MLTVALISQLGLFSRHHARHRPASQLLISKLVRLLVLLVDIAFGLAVVVHKLLLDLGLV